MSGDVERPLERLTTVCERIAGGQYEDLDALFDMMLGADMPDAVAGLAEAFASMAVQVEAREFRLTEMLADLNEAHRRLGETHKQVASENVDLRNEVERLRIEIDHDRRDKEVSEIADTDYFQMLSTRAKDMRNRYARDKAPIPRNPSSE